jgi:hypothetical protein
MQKLSGTSSGKNNKSCGIFHHESNKIGFAFFLIFVRFFMQFIRISKGTLLSFSFADRPLKWFRSLQIYPYFADCPSGKLESLQCGPRGRSARLRPNFGEGRRWGRAWLGAGVARVWFGGSAVGDGLPRGGHTGGRGWWPPRLPVPDEGWLGGKGSEPASCSGGKGRRSAR